MWWTNLRISHRRHVHYHYGLRSLDIPPPSIFLSDFVGILCPSDQFGFGFQTSFQITCRSSRLSNVSMWLGFKHVTQLPTRRTWAFCLTVSIPWVTFSVILDPICPWFLFRIRGSSVSIVSRLQAWRPGFNSHRGSGGIFSLRHLIETGSGAHPASYPMDTGAAFRGGIAAGAWRWPLTSS
jgi:hypothetical protein